MKTKEEIVKRIENHAKYYDIMKAAHDDLDCDAYLDQMINTKECMKELKWVIEDES